MTLRETDSLEYGRVFPAPLTVFHGAAFTELNRGKCETLHYLVVNDSGADIGITLGERGGCLLSPFSAPFGGFTTSRADVSLEHVESAVAGLSSFARGRKLGVKLALPPSPYAPALIPKFFSALLRGGFRLDFTDLNYTFDLRGTSPYGDLLQRNARKNLKAASTFPFRLERVSSQEGRMAAYAIIAENRTSKGYPLRMTYAQVEETVKIIPADFFILHIEEEAVASAIVFRVQTKIAQVIYWGDVPGHSSARPVNFLASRLFEFYRGEKFDFLDVGPSSENGIPNYGLCRFKESIGCGVGEKYCLSLNAEALQ